jgi:hypothetical protein
MIRVKLFTNFRFRICLKVLVNTLVVFVGTATVCWCSIITGCEVLVLKGGCENGSGLHNA